CDQLWNNRIEDHYYGGTAPFDARSKDGSTLYAERYYRGAVSGPTDTRNRELDHAASSLRDVLPPLTSPPPRQGGPEPLAVAVRDPGGGVESGSESGGEDSVRGLVAEALAAEADEDWTAAFALYLAALRAAEDDDGRRLAFSAVARLLGTPE